MPENSFRWQKSFSVFSRTGTDIYKSSFFPQTIRDWNLLTDSLITASECAVDSVTKFTSLVRARD